jgi:replicative DNA helicase
MDKDYLLSRISYESFYTRHVDSLKVKGGESYGLCFMHDDSKPSLRVNISKGVWTCPVCNKGGGIFDLYMQKYGVTFKTAMTEIAEGEGIYMEKPKVVATYEYHDADGNLLYEKQRLEPGDRGKKKKFQFNSIHGYERGCVAVMYNLPAIIGSSWAIIAEGEKCADKLIGWGLPATTLDRGADSKLSPDDVELLKAKKVVILPDNDDAGKRYAVRLAEQLNDVKIVGLDLPPKGDIVDWSGDKEKLMAIIKRTPLWEPKRDYVSVRSILPSVVENMLYADLDKLGERTGFDAIDKRLGIFRRKNLIVIAGRPSMGKSALMTSMMLNMSMRGTPVLLFTPEMSKEETAERLLCQINDINMQNVMQRYNHECNIARVNEAAEKLEKLPIWIDDTGGVQLEWVEARLKTAIKEHGIKCVFIDYLQLMNTLAKDAGKEVAYIGYISRNLKRIAKENDVPIIMLSQLNRDCEKRNDKRPQLSDLKGSGDIEQDGDVIAFVYRDEVYNIRSEDFGTAEVIIRKFRNGKTGTARLAFLSDSMRFADLCEEEEH